jgi:hypothetical protein
MTSGCPLPRSVPSPTLIWYAAVLEDAARALAVATDHPDHDRLARECRDAASSARFRAANPDLYEPQRNMQ